MRFKYIFFLLGVLVLSTSLNAQYSLRNFKTITSKGEIPQEFYTYLSPNSDIEPKMKALFSSGLLIYGSELNDYLNTIKVKLLKDYPEYQEKIKIFIYRSTTTNLYSDSNVVIINLGLISRVQNESELAFFMAHEISHILLHHQRKFKKSSIDYQQNSGDINNVYHYRSEEQELEADLFAFDDLFVKSGYNLEDLAGAFYLLENLNCNYSEQILNKAFFETSYYTFPESYFQQNLFTKEVVNNKTEIGDNMHIKHMNKIIALRKIQFNKWIDSQTKLMGASFLQSDSLFFYIRNLARFESLNIDLTFYNFNDLMYNLAVLIHQFPDNPFINQVCIAAHYNLFIQRSYSDKITLLINYKEVDGEKQFYHFFYNKLSRDELGLISLRYAWEAHKAYPDNNYFFQVAKSIVKVLHEKNKLNYNDYSDYPMNFDLSTIVEDTTTVLPKEVPKNKYTRIKSKSVVKVIPTKKFNTLNYMLVELRKDSLFMNLIEVGLKEYEDDKVLDAITEKRFQNLITDFVVVNPSCVKTQNNNKVELYNNEVVYNPINYSIKKLKLTNKIVSLNDLNSYNDEKYNHFVKMQLYFYNFSLASTYNIIYYQSIDIQHTCDYFGSDNFNFVQATYTHNKNRIYRRIYYTPFLFFNPIASPFTFLHMFARTSDVESYFIIVNAVTSQTEYVNILKTEDYNWKQILSQFIYNNYYDISKKQLRDEK